MNNSDDIANLFSRLGMSSDSYREIEHNLPYLTQHPAPIPAVAMQQSVDPITLSTPDEPAQPTDDLGSLRRQMAERRKHRREPEARPTASPELPGRPRIIVVMSLKGGVGRTTLAAALATQLSQAPGHALALDLDPQNSLGLHLGLDAEASGVIQAATGDKPTGACVHDAFAGARCIPFGTAHDDELWAFKTRLRQQPGWLAEQVSELGLGRHDTLIIDTPTGAGPLLDQALSIADDIVLVTLADPACFLRLGSLPALLAPVRQRANPPRCHYVVNQFDESNPLEEDLLEELTTRFDRQLLGCIKRDPSLGYALADNLPPLSGASTGAADILELVRALQQQPRTTFSRESIPS